MHPAVPNAVSRRTVLKTATTLGLVSTLGVGGAIAVKPERKSKSFGTGNGIGAFLNEKAAYKPSPVWDSGIVDLTGRGTVEIEVGAMTNVEMPDAPFDTLPVAFAPQAVKVSPGTEVVWTWSAYGASVPPIPHDVVSLKGGVFNSGIRLPGGSDFSHTFDEAGTYLYYCTPHGAPFPVHPHGAPPNALIYNEFGMRGAVLVADE